MAGCNPQLALFGQQQEPALALGQFDGGPHRFGQQPGQRGLSLQGLGQEARGGALLRAARVEAVGRRVAECSPFAGHIAEPEPRVVAQCRPVHP